MCLYDSNYGYYLTSILGQMLRFSFLYLSFCRCRKILCMHVKCVFCACHLTFIGNLLFKLFFCISSSLLPSLFTLLCSSLPSWWPCATQEAPISAFKLGDPKMASSRMKGRFVFFTLGIFKIESVHFLVSEEARTHRPCSHYKDVSRLMFLH